MNLDRFSQPLDSESRARPAYYDNDKSVGHCSCCEGDIWEGDKVYRFEEERFCSKDCASDWIIENYVYNEQAEAEEN